MQIQPNILDRFIKKDWLNPSNHSTVTFITSIARYVKIKPGLLTSKAYWLRYELHLNEILQITFSYGTTKVYLGGKVHCFSFTSLRTGVETVYHLILILFMVAYKYTWGYFIIIIVYIIDPYRIVQWIVQVISVDLGAHSQDQACMLR